MLKSNIMITGAAGFIGLNFVKFLLNKGAYGNLWLVDKLTYAANVDEFVDLGFEYDNIDCTLIDIADRAVMEWMCDKYAIDVVINFAAESHVDNSIKDCTEFINTNVLGVQVLLEVCKDRQIPFVQISTDEVFGSVQEPAIPGLTKYNPSNPYAASKAGANHLVRSYGKTYDLDYLITYCTNNYGPYQNKEKFIPVIINSLLNGRTIPVYGFGGNMRDWIYVEDHCNALYQIINTKFFKTGTTIQIPKQVAIAGQEMCTNIELIQKIRKIMGIDKSLADCIQYVQDRPAHDTMYMLDDNWMRKVLNWKPEISCMEEGLEKTVEYYVEKFHNEGR